MVDITLSNPCAIVPTCSRLMLAALYCLVPLELKSQNGRGCANCQASVKVVAMIAHGESGFLCVKPAS